MPISSLPTYATGDTIEALTPNTLRDNDGLLDARTGGDPASTGKILKSNSPLGGAWLAPGTESYVLMIVAGEPVWTRIVSASITDGTIAAADLAPGAAVGNIANGTILAPMLAAGAAAANIGYTPANKAGEAFTNIISVTGNSGTNNNLRAIDLVNNGGGTSGCYIRFVSGPSNSMIIGMFVGNSIVQVIDNNGVAALDLRSADGQLYRYGNKVWDAATDGAGSGLDADLLDGRNTGTAAGNIAFYDGAGKVMAAISADSAGSAGSAGSASTAGTATNFSGSLAGDVTGTQGATVVAAKVPSGLIAMVETAAGATGIPVGWTRYTPLNGRLPVGDGITFGHTFNQTADDGSNWTPGAGLGATNNVTATAGPVTASGSGSEVVGSTSATLFKNPVTHTHPGPSVSIGGTVDLTGTATQWIPPCHVMVFCRKN